MGELEESIKRHPAGNAQEQTIWDTAWAISKAMQVGRDDEQERIIKLLEAQSAVTGYVEIEFLKLYALIKGEKSE
jgi:hypothetical protein